MFEFLFKYPLSQYQQSDWFFASGWPLSTLLVMLAVVSLVIIISIALRRLSAPAKLLVASLQILAAAVLLLMLWQPSLRSKLIVPGDNSVALLVDTSRSMHYVDSGDSRLAQVAAAVQNSGILDELKADFNIELHSVADQVAELDFDALPPPGKSSRLKTALTDTLNSGSQAVLSGVVLFTDGADTSSLEEAWWQRLGAAGVPVFPIGVGREALPEDIALQAVSLRESATPNTRINARITVRHGKVGSARLRVTDGAALLYAADLQLPDGVAESSHSIAFNSGEQGIRDLRFELAPLQGEINIENNSQRRILTVQDSRKRILYIEGEPRWEFKFIRRAITESAEVEIVSLLQTSPNKFYRQGVRDAAELESGFPTDQQTLFNYDAVIIGSFEAAKLSDEQQRFLRDFVRVRGGALLMIAGPRGLAEGGWARTTVAQALPASLDYTNSYSRERARVQLTNLGEETGWLRFAVDDNANQLLWDELPELADVQIPGTLKAGASALLEAKLGDTRIPLLIQQRYGRGKSFILATSGTWRWQMSLPSQDQRHEQFWQGLLGELVAGSLSRLSVSTERVVYYDEGLVTVTIDARDELYQPDLSAQMRVTLSAADNAAAQPEPVQALPTSTPGRYQARFSVPHAGDYAVSVSDQNGEEVSAKRWFLRENDRVEDFALARDSLFLSRLASETGGRYLDLTELDQLPEVLRKSQALLVKDEILPLWNMPAAFLLLFLFKMVEWLLRLRWNRI